MPVNVSSIKASSRGAWQGDDPLNYAFPLLILQTTLVLLISRILVFFLKPLRQPKVVAEILGGILLGPSALGRNKEFLRLVFPSWSTPILESVANIGLLFFLFLVGLELDLSSIRQSGKRVFGIALAGISFPFVFGLAVSVFLRKAVHGEDKVGYGQYIVFMGVALSITAFPVLARILAELKLLTTQAGQTAMAAAALNDVAAWILLALAVALPGKGSGGHASSPLITLWVLISGSAFIAFMLVVIRPVMNWVSKQASSSNHDFLDEAYLCLSLAGVMLSGFITDLIGIHAIFGAFVFGLMIPNGGEFAAKLIKRIEDFVSCLLLPLYFASSGLKTDVAKIRGAEAWGLLVLVISTACAGKILGTFLVAMLCMIPARESLVLGVLMNTRGLVELIILNIGKEKKVLNDEMFAILVLMTIVTTFMTTPTLMAIYKPSSRRQVGQQSPLAENSQEKLQILACIHGPGNVPALINLIESTRTQKKSLLKLYVLHLVELTDRSSSIMMVQRHRKNGLPFLDCFCRGKSNDQIATALEAYGHVGQVSLHHSTAISALSTMHEDICHVAEEKRVTMIILPFHKDVGYGWRGVNQSVLETAPCSVAVFVDRGFGGSGQEVGPASSMPKRVCIMFFGGPDDRKVLELGGRMAEHPAVSVTIVRFMEKARVENRASSYNCLENDKNEGELDAEAMDQFNKKWNGQFEYIEKKESNITKEVLAIGQSKVFELLVVGKGATAMKPAADHQEEHPELGPIGELLASSDYDIVPSVLVVQQHNLVRAKTTTMSKMVGDKDAMTIDNESSV